MLVCGMGVTKNEVQGVLYLTSGAEHGSVLAAYHLGLANADGLYGLPVDKAEAKQYLEAALQYSRCDHISAIKKDTVIIKLRDLNGPLISGTLEELSKRSDEGDVDAMEQLGWNYLNGMYGYPEDHYKAYRWFFRAMTSFSSVVGKARCGFMLMNGRGVEKNVDEGFRLLKEAADCGSKFAAFHVGRMYHDGSYGQKQDDHEAEYYLDEALWESDFNYDYVLEMQKEKVQERLGFIEYGCDYNEYYGNPGGNA
jgi:hypothetical protein